MNTEEQKVTLMSDTSLKFKPCPFCGNTELIGPFQCDYIGDHPHHYMWIECDKCPCGMQIDGNDMKVLEEAWNKRFVEK